MNSIGNVSGPPQQRSGLSRRQFLWLTGVTLLAGCQTAQPPPPAHSSAPGRDQGLTNEQVAEQLVISLRTVNTHLTSIYSKIGISSRSAATRYAIEHHLI